MFFNILATFAECEVDPRRMRTREGMAVARAKGKRMTTPSGEAGVSGRPGSRTAVPKPAVPDTFGFRT